MVPMHPGETLGCLGYGCYVAMLPGRERFVKQDYSGRFRHVNLSSKQSLAATFHPFQVWLDGPDCERLPAKDL